MPLTDTTFYFAYGSNMSVERLQARIPSARPYCNAMLTGHELRFHKKGADGSAKCDVVATGNSHHEVHGVIFEFNLAEKPILDRCEGPRYKERMVELISEHNGVINAFLYYVADKSAHTDHNLKPFHWYKHHVVYGARQAGLPQHYIEALVAVDSVIDHNRERTERELSIYPVLNVHDLPFTV